MTSIFHQYNHVIFTLSKILFSGLFNIFPIIIPVPPPLCYQSQTNKKFLFQNQQTLHLITLSQMWFNYMLQMWFYKLTKLSTYTLSQASLLQRKKNKANL